MQILVQGAVRLCSILLNICVCSLFKEASGEFCRLCLKYVYISYMYEWPAPAHVSPRSPDHMQYLIIIDSLVKLNLSLNLFHLTPSSKK